jgi:MFS family permease
LTVTPPASEPGAAGAAFQAGASRPWAVVALAAAALFINYVDRGAVPTAAHLIQDELGFSERQLGLLFSAFFWTYALLQIPVGWIAERYGAQRVLAAGLATWGCATLLAGFAHSFMALLALRLLLGIGESAGFPCMSKLLATVVPIRSLGTANGVVAFAYLFGPAVGTYLGGLLMARYGWRASFWVLGAASLLWLLPWSRMSAPRPAAGTRIQPGPSFATLIRQPALWGTSLGLFSANYTFYFMLTWLPFYLIRERGFSTLGMAGVTGSAYVVHAVSALAAGWAVDRVVRRYQRANLAYKSVMVAMHVGTIPCMLCIALAAPRAALVAIFVYQVLDGIGSPGEFAMSQILAGPAAAARWVGVQNSVGNFAGVIAPALTGLLVAESHSFASAFAVAAAVSLLGLVGWVWMTPRLAPLAWQRSGAVAEGAPA